MSDGTFNIAKGKAAYYAGLPATNDALIVLLLKSTGLVADSLMVDYADVGAVLAGASDESDTTNYARKTITSGVTVTVDTTNDRVDVDMPDQTWTALGSSGTTQGIGKLIIAYDGDTTAGTDANLIPLTYHDCAFTADGTDFTAVIATSGFYRAS